MQQAITITGIDLDFQKLNQLRRQIFELAERVRFELTILFWSILDFESSAFGHSATSPDRTYLYRLNLARTRILTIWPGDNSPVLNFTKYFGDDAVKR